MKFDRFFLCTGRGSSDSYIFIDSSKIDYLAGAKRMAFKWTAEFDLTPHKGSVVDNYPVVYDDLTVYGGGLLTEVTFESIPPKVKSRFTKWKKLQ